MLLIRAVFIIILSLLEVTKARPRAAVAASQNGGKISQDEITIKEQTGQQDAPVFGEPTCEQLRTMWRFSKRQSRAAEITNEIPTYRDPFINNIWQAPYDSYARSRSGGMRIGQYRNGYRPVYGRIVHKAPLHRVIGEPARNRAFEEVVRLYSDSTRNGYNSAGGRRQQQFRFPGGYTGRTVTVSPISGSFQHLKELIKTERARELQQQRIAEEIAARAAVLKAAIGKQDSQRRKYEQTAKYMYDNGMEDDSQLMNDEPSMRDYMMVSLDSNDESAEKAPPLTFPDPGAPPSSVSRDGRAGFWDKKDEDELMDFNFNIG